MGRSWKASYTRKMRKMALKLNFVTSERDPPCCDVREVRQFVTSERSLPCCDVIPIVQQLWPFVSFPQDVQFGDIDYMIRQLDFTYDPVAYAGLPDFVRSIRKDGLRYIIILVILLEFGRLAVNRHAVRACSVGSASYKSLGFHAFLKSALYSNHSVKRV